MNAQALQQELEGVTALAGVTGCALVEMDTGMAWATAGELPQLQRLVESSCDYWRMATRRQDDFSALGGMRAIVAIHAAGRVTLVASGQGLLLVTLSREPDAVDWKQWTARVARLHKVVASV